MKWLKIKKKILGLAINIALYYYTFNLAQEALDLCNYRQIVKYEDIIDDFVNLMKEQGIEEPIEIFDYFNYALWNGYLSDAHTYKYNIERDIFFSNYGLSCITGDGVCLNKADFLVSVYEQYGYDAYTVACYANYDEETIINPIRTNSNFVIKSAEDSNINFENLDELASFLLKPLNLLFGNHAVTCVEYDGEFYYFDPTNLAYLEKIDVNTLEVINEKGFFEIKYLASMFVGDIDVLRIINDNDNDYSKLLDDSGINIDLEELEQFYCENSVNYELIDKQLQNKNQLVLYTICWYIVNKIVSFGVKKGRNGLKKLLLKKKKSEINDN